MATSTLNVSKLVAGKRVCDSYVLITPARNEAQLLELSIPSVVKQTRKPAKWVIVSDGSTDGTDDLVRRSAREHTWIELVKLPDRGLRHFAGKVDAFNAGYASVRHLEYDIIGNLDADVTFDDDDYFAFMLNRFTNQPGLGVAGTAYREHDTIYPYRFTSLEDVSGACQLFRRKCFEDIGGYLALEAGGIDVIAVFSAQSKGWQTRTFTEKLFEHHRKVGSAQRGTYSKLFNDGSKDYILGSHPLWEFLRAIYQMKNPPYIVGGLLLLTGYLRAMVSQSEKTIPRELMRIRRNEQMRRLKESLRKLAAD